MVSKTDSQGTSDSAKKRRTLPIAFMLWGTAFACCYCKLSKVESQEARAVKQSATVDAQPLLLLTERMSEALDTGGNPLSANIQAGLKRVSNLEGDEQVTTELQRLLDPECDFLIEIERDGTIKPQLLKASLGLDENGWRTSLVKVINRSGVAAKLRSESPNALPIPNGPADEISKRWL